MWIDSLLVKKTRSYGCDGRDLKGETGSVVRQLAGGEDTLFWLWVRDLKGETGSVDRQLVGGEEGGIYEGRDLKCG